MSIYNSSLGILRIAEVIKRIKETNGRVHFCGVLGAGQRGIAELLLKEGVRVSGSDTGRAADAARLVELGLEFYPTHEAKHVDGAGLLVYTLAISEDNPEYKRAGELGIPRSSRAEVAAFLFSLAKNRIAVSGSHGKSTVVAMLDLIFNSADKTASVISGASLFDGESSRRGLGENFIVEACEYKDSFLKFTPSVAIVNNVELDHTDYFKNLDAVVRSFAKFASRAERVALLNCDDTGALSVLEKTSAKTLTYGTSSQAFYRITNTSVGACGAIFTLERGGKSLGEFRLNVPGIFNVSNAAAAIAAAYESEIDPNDARHAIAAYRGIGRRLEYIGEYKSRPVFYDYAHHPTEIYSSVTALRTLGCDPLTVVFKSHTFSRTADLWSGFVRSLSFADYVIVGDIFGAREVNERAVSAELLAKSIGQHALYARDEDVPTALDSATRGAIVLMGAADMSAVIDGMKIKFKGKK